MSNEKVKYILIFIPLYLSGAIIYFIYSFTPSANCKHAVAIALTRHAIYKIYFGINLLASFRKPGQFTQRLDCQVTVFIRLIISIDQTSARAGVHVSLVFSFAMRILVNKINRTGMKVKRGVCTFRDTILLGICECGYIICDALARRARA